MRLRAEVGAPRGPEREQVRNLHLVPQRELRVLHTLRRSTRGGSTYADLVESAVPPGCRQEFFSWRRALLGRYDVLHAHWPEQLVRDSRHPWLRVVRRRLLDLLLLRLAVRGVPLVWTAHNLAPHEAGTPAERRSLARFSRHVDLTVKLTSASPVSTGRRQLTIAHSHYRAHYDRVLGGPVVAAAVPGRLLHFGIIRPYKGVDVLLDCFRRVADPSASLRVVGHPHAGQGELVEAACAADSRISALLRYVDDAELAAEITAAQLVVLPYRGTMHNSGTLLAALSLGRPVLVPRSPTNSAISRRVGAGWVLEYDGELDEHVLADALARSAVPPADAPDLSEHEPAVVAAQHRAAYDTALAGRRPLLGWTR
ncbi:glycosyltransferase [Kineococcus sp. SYSU DK006]|uniref:glycosyltransferase n=1 Tax=Kineococcus sp. SYSU DK006 TaxID=3383127 RepID=UPI003D7EF31B